jgi:hypothetical protein
VFKKYNSCKYRMTLKYMVIALLGTYYILKKSKEIINENNKGNNEIKCKKIISYKLICYLK